MDKKEAKTIDIILLLTAIAAAGFLIRAIAIGSKAVFDSVLVLLLLFLMYKYKKNFDLNVATASAGAVFFVLHLLGSHGLYDFYVFGSIGYDKLLHFYGPFVLSIIIFNYLAHYLKQKKARIEVGHVVFFAVLITLGINAFQEVAEFTGNSLLGKGDGVFFYGSGDLGGNDTPKDLIANFLGVTLSGIILYFRKRNKK